MLHMRKIFTDATEGKTVTNYVFWERPTLHYFCRENITVEFGHKT
jgi:hypothetical protein